MSKFDRPLVRYYLNSTHPLAVCNDNTSAAYYFRPAIDNGSGSKKWVIVLKGGGWCWDDQSCLSRYPDLKSSKWLPPTMTENFVLNHTYHKGILSTNSSINPLFYNANHVYLWYCSSDSHLGNGTMTITTNKNTTNNNNNNDNSSGARDGTITLQFRGKQIVHSMIEHLWNNFSDSLANSSLILIAGDSAGAVGVLNNVDYISDQLNGYAYDYNNTNINFNQSGLGSTRLNVRGLVDAGFFLDFRLYNGTGNNDNDSTHSYLTNFSTIAHGLDKNFHIQWNKKCVNYYQLKNATWKCFHAQYMIQFIQTPLIFHQFSYDRANLLYFDGIGDININDKNQMRYAKQFRNEMEYWQDDVLNMKYLFRPACFRHQIIDGKYGGMTDIFIDNTNFVHVLAMWIQLESESLQLDNKGINNISLRYVDNCSYFSCNEYCNDGFYRYTVNGTLNNGTRNGDGTGHGHHHHSGKHVNYVGIGAACLVVLILILAVIPNIKKRKSEQTNRPRRIGRRKQWQKIENEVD